MKRLYPLAAMLIAALVQSACSNNATREVVAPTLLSQEDASIPFFNSQSRGSLNWQANGDEGLWIQDVRRDWYYADLNGPCFGLDFATRLGFDTGNTDRLDRFSRIILPDNQMPGGCVIRSLKRSEAPPDGKKHALEVEAEKKSE